MKKNYILVGDSIVYGIGDYDNCGWSTLFKKYIIGKDGTKECNNFVHIAAFPGARSYNILDRIDHILNGYKYDDFENIVIYVGRNFFVSETEKIFHFHRNLNITDFVAFICEGFC